MGPPLGSISQLGVRYLLRRHVLVCFEGVKYVKNDGSVVSFMTDDDDEDLAYLIGIALEVAMKDADLTGERVRSAQRASESLQNVQQRFTILLQTAGLQHHLTKAGPKVIDISLGHAY
ncbi:hypothetical protein BC939DRAFT_481395 [Gamsiella multidivaricata]|uniref:uncharacterized protein n=1 Tax=Gamsiella multidivaricata TaxID=101098 RepID=UPI00221EF268|nr:uncharacterized protein BC939DRAFT_481395 [Gamsiella multidivaricata]KAI7817189.1 hypothetical protein BC939DRAFT_481395 [Gamsiella multidivaricata]